MFLGRYVAVERRIGRGGVEASANEVLMEDAGDCETGLIRWSRGTSRSDVEGGTVIDGGEGQEGEVLREYVRMLLEAG